MLLGRQDIYLIMSEWTIQDLVWCLAKTSEDFAIFFSTTGTCVFQKEVQNT